MPIRFYCPFCDRLLGIAQRKAGAVVECPSCHGKVGVPTDESGPSPAAQPAWLVPVPGPAAPAPANSSDIVLTSRQVTALLLALAVLLGLAFAGGLLVGALG